MKNTIYYKQADLLLQILPIVSREKNFALKGGTAINFYYRELPRLSVDIDLCYLPINEREQALQKISESLGRIAESVKRLIPGTSVAVKTMKGTDLKYSLIINNRGITVKIEPNTVIRGTIFKAESRGLSNKAYEAFERYVPMQVLSFEDLYAGKICAALDRQHPRDFYDIKLLLENEGITDQLRKAFIVYLISHSRPMIELLSPNLLVIKTIFENEFSGMTVEPVTLDELLDARKQLIRILSTELTDIERQFLLSFKSIGPKWDLLGLNNIDKLPAVQWKLYNLGKMDPRKHKKSVEKLSEFLKL